ncbi:hypothetical protein ACJX0J_017317 [Zea mays]
MVQEIQRKGWQINLWRWLQDENLKNAQRYTLAQEAHDQIKWKCGYRAMLEVCSSIFIGTVVLLEKKLILSPVVNINSNSRGFPVATLCCHFGLVANSSTLFPLNKSTSQSNMIFLLLASPDVFLVQTKKKPPSFISSSVSSRSTQYMIHLVYGIKNYYLLVFNNEMILGDINTCIWKNIYTIAKGVDNENQKICQFAVLENTNNMLMYPALCIIVQVQKIYIIMIYLIQSQ